MNKTLSNFLPYAMLFCLVVMWGTAFAALKISLETISPLKVMSFRLIIGSNNQLLKHYMSNLLIIFEKFKKIKKMVINMINFLFVHFEFY